MTSEDFPLVHSSSRKYEHDEAKDPFHGIYLPLHVAETHKCEDCARNNNVYYMYYAWHKSVNNSHTKTVDCGIHKCVDCVWHTAYDTKRC